MLHVRDCPGTTSTFDVCPFPWCRKMKHLLYHLVSCEHPESCGICAPSKLGKSWRKLRGLNEHRFAAIKAKLPAPKPRVKVETPDGDDEDDDDKLDLSDLIEQEEPSTLNEEEDEDHSMEKVCPETQALLEGLV